jgi:PleD family two-component response regulator
MTTYDMAGLNVLVVDDSPHMLKLMSVILRAMGIRRCECLDEPQRALDVVKRHKPQLLITDILMSPLDGISLTAAVRRLQPDPVAFTPIFVLSGFTDREHVLRAHEAGAHEVLAKPISARALYERICALIEHPRDFVASGGYFGPDRRAGTRAFSGPERRAEPRPTPDGDDIEIDF